MILCMTASHQFGLRGFSYWVEVAHGQAQACASCKAPTRCQHHDGWWLERVLWLQDCAEMCQFVIKVENRRVMHYVTKLAAAILTGKRSLPMYQPPV